MNKVTNAPYQDPRLPIERRVEDLLSRMTLEQKIAQLCCYLPLPSETEQAKMLANGIGHIGLLFRPARTVSDVATENEGLQRFLVENTELGIPAILHTEALGGGLFIEATSFPSAMGLSATWDPEKVQAMGDVIRKQLKAVGYGQALSPVMDVSREPRWGRIGETYGEDPMLVSIFSVAFVKGIQGKDLKTGIAATSKHFLGYGSPEGGLNLSVERIPSIEMREVYGKPFEAAIHEAGLASVMNSYGSINGEPVISSRNILTGLLRDEMGFEGVTVSDYRSIDRLVYDFKTSADMTEAGIKSITAGMDVELPLPRAYGKGFREAVKASKVDIAVIDRSVRRVLTLKYKLGLFENPYPDREAINRVFHLPGDDELSCTLARESITLLKNEGRILPLSKSVARVAVIGPNAGSLRNLFGSYSYAAAIQLTSSLGGITGLEQPNIPQDELMSKDSLATIDSKIGSAYPMAVTVLGAIQGKIRKAQVSYAPGCGVLETDTSGFAEAVKNATNADIAVIVVGEREGWGEGCSTGEGIDTSHVGLPGVQEDLVRAVHVTGTPVVLVHMSSRPLGSQWVVENIPAILTVWHPGQSGGRAIADVLFGDYNPGGRLPRTVPRSTGQIQTYYGHPNGSGYEGRGSKNTVKGYVNESARPLFYFGHGLSYTEFNYTSLVITPGRVSSQREVTISCVVTNSGRLAGDEVVQLYISDRLASMVRPVKELAGFKRITLKSGESKQVLFTVEMTQMAFLNEGMQWIVEPGEMDVMVGPSSVDIKLKGTFTITGEMFYPGRERAFYAKANVV